MRFILLGITIINLLACRGYGEKISYGESHIFFKGVSKELAQKVGDQLKAMHYFDSLPKTVQLLRHEAGYALRFVVKPAYITNPKLLQRLLRHKIDVEMALNLVDSIQAIACDNHLLPVIEIPSFPYRGEVPLYFTDSINKLDVQKLSEVIDADSILNKASEVYIDKPVEIIHIKFVNLQAEIDRQLFLKYLGSMTKAFSKNIFNNRMVDISLADNFFVDQDIIFFEK